MARWSARLSRLCETVAARIMTLKFLRMALRAFRTRRAPTSALCSPCCASGRALVQRDRYWSLLEQ